MKYYEKSMKKALQILVILTFGTMNFGCSNVELSIGGELHSKNKPSEIVLPKEEIQVKELYINSTPESIPFVKKYKGQLPSEINYGLIIAEKANLREKPLTKSKLIKELKFMERVELLELAEFKGQDWYKVKNSAGTTGYVYYPAIKKRIFQFDKSLERVTDVEKFIETAKSNGDSLALIDAYTPDGENKILSKKKDKYGRYQTQSALGKVENEIVYVPDRAIGKIISTSTKNKNEKINKVKIEGMTEESIVLDSKSVIKAERLEDKPINKAIVVDIENQNLVLYEKIKNEWTIVSYSYSKTGYESALGFETPRGSYITDLGKEKMLYTGSDGKVQGFASYAIRFSGGGYLHGTPLSLEEAKNESYYLNFRESFLGTFEGTRKCIRTTKNHAQFVYSWVFNKENAPKEQLPVYEKIKDNVLFIVF